MTVFDKTETRFGHYDGKLVKYDKKILAIGGYDQAMVEELNSTKYSWEKHQMSPVNGYSKLWGFSALSIEKSLYIFGKSRI